MLELADYIYQVERYYYYARLVVRMTRAVGKPLGW
jgi:hypothetical protein